MEGITLREAVNFSEALLRGDICAGCADGTTSLAGDGSYSPLWIHGCGRGNEGKVGVLVSCARGDRWAERALEGGFTASQVGFTVREEAMEGEDEVEEEEEAGR